MLSRIANRLTNIVLLITVVALAVALVRSGSRQDASKTELSEAQSKVLDIASLSDATADQLLLAANSLNDESGLSTLTGAADGQGGADFLAAPPSGGSSAGKAKRGERGSAIRVQALPRLPDELVRRCIEIAKDIDEERGKVLEDLREKNPQEFDRAIRIAGPRLLAMAQLKQRDPELYEMKVGELSQMLQVSRVAENLREAIRTGSAGDIPALSDQLRGLLRIQMALSMKSRAEYLCRLEDQIKSLREELERDGRHFNENLEGRFNALLVEPSPHGAPAGSARNVSETVPAGKISQ